MWKTDDFSVMASMAVLWKSINVNADQLRVGNSLERSNVRVEN